MARSTKPLACPAIVGGGAIARIFGEMSSLEETEVVIAGAGPVGLMAALCLTRQDVAVRIVDPAPSPSRHSKAIVVQPAALEALERVGVAETLVSSGLPVFAYNMYDAGGRRLVRHEMQGLPTRFPFSLHVSQRETERVLTQALRHAGIEVERGAGVDAFSQDGDGVTVRIGDENRIRARFLLGCDGARSTVRRQAGLELAGTTYADRFVLADCDVDSDLDPKEGHSFLARQGVLSVLPLLKNQRIILPLRSERRELSEPMLREWIAERRPKSVRLEAQRVHWLSDFRIHCRSAERYRVGRVFLCGDAAHIHSPAGGQGLNVGLGDAFELAWRLSMVLHRAASPRLLDSYEPERLAIARRVLAQTDRLTKMFTTTSLFGRGARRAFFGAASRVPSLRRKIRNDMAGLSDRHAGEGVLAAAAGGRAGHLRTGERMPHVAVGSDGVLLSELDRSGAMLLVLIARDADSGSRLAGAAREITDSYRAPPAIVLAAPSELPAPGGVRVLVDPSASVSAATGIDRGAMLVRPDGRIAWAGEGGGLDGLRAFLDGFLLTEAEAHRVAAEDQLSSVALVSGRSTAARE